MVDIGHSGVSLQVLVRIGVKVELSRRTEQGLGIATSVQPREKHRKPLPLLLTSHRPANNHRQLHIRRDPTVGIPFYCHI
jgi:hypothetical protein